MNSHIQNEMIDLVRSRDNSTFSNLVEGITREHIAKTKRRRRIIYLSTALSLAACLILAFILINPAERIKVNGFVAMASGTAQIPIHDIGINVRGETPIDTTLYFKEVKIVRDEKMVGYYFVHKGILYLSYKDMDGSIIRQMTVDGQLEYFYKLPSGETFLLDLTKENKLLPFVKESKNQ